MFSCLVEGRGGVCARTVVVVVVAAVVVIGVVLKGTGGTPGTSGTDVSCIAREDLDCSDEAPRDRGVIPDDAVLIRPCVIMLLSLADRLGRTAMESFLLKLLGVLVPVELAPDFVVYVVSLADRAQLDVLADAVAAGAAGAAAAALLSDALAARRLGTLFCVIIRRPPPLLLLPPPERLELVDVRPDLSNPGSCGSGFSDGPLSKNRSFNDLVAGRLLGAVLCNEDVSFLLAMPTRRCISMTATPS